MLARHYVSKIRGLLRFHSPDIKVSDRLILSVLLPINNKLLSQQISKRRAWGVESLYTTLSCLQMEEVPLYTCCDTTSDCNIAKSKIELPDILDSYYNLAIKRVSSIDGKVRFDELTTPERYANILKIYPNTNKKYYFIKEKHLYITDPNIMAVSISAAFKELVDPDKYKDCQTQDCGEQDPCEKNPLDLELKTLPKLEEDIIRIAVDEILRTYGVTKQQITSGDDVEGN